MKDRPSRNPDLITREVLGETLLVPIRGGIAQMQQIFVLNEVGAFIWHRLDGETSLEEIHGEILQGFDVEEDVAWQDLLGLVATLESKGLVLRAAE